MSNWTLTCSYLLFVQGCLQDSLCHNGVFDELDPHYSVLALVSCNVSVLIRRPQMWNEVRPTLCSHKLVRVNPKHALPAVRKSDLAGMLVPITQSANVYLTSCARSLVTASAGVPRVFRFVLRSVCCTLRHWSGGWGLATCVPGISIDCGGWTNYDSRTKLSLFVLCASKSFLS